jgi:spore germination protein
MIIYVVQQGDTIHSIAEGYGVPFKRLVQDNGITNPNELAIGQTIVIVYPKETYTVQEGDTLSDIADKFDVSQMQLLRNNPYLSDREFIYPGEIIVISYEDNKIGRLSTGGYVYPFIDIGILRKTLPFLTYLSIYSYAVSEDGRLNDIDDLELITIAKEYGVAPIMLITGTGETTKEEINVIKSILLDSEAQDQLINSTLIVLKDKGYYGVTITTPYIAPQSRKLYVNFMDKFARRIKAEGYAVFDTLTYNTFELMTGTRYDELEYIRFGEMLDGLMIISYDWGYSVGFPVVSVSVDLIEDSLRYMIMQIPSEKIFLGMSNIGYIWELPFELCTSRGQSISYDAAIELAYTSGSEIQFSEISKASYFQYVSYNEYMVQFRDARGIDSYLRLIWDYGLKGLGIWNIMSFSAQMWLLINTQYEIEKIKIIS